MLTRQNYVGKGVLATQSGQTANLIPQLGQLSYKRQPTSDLDTRPSILLDPSPAFCWSALHSLSGLSLNFSVMENELLTTSGPINSPSDSVLSFIANNQDIVGKSLDETEAQIGIRLEQTPIHYTNLLDGLAFVRAFTPKPDEAYDAHYALFIDRHGNIQWLTVLHEDFDCHQEYLPTSSLDPHKLKQALIEFETQAVLLVSSRSSTYDVFSAEDLWHTDFVQTILEMSGVEVLDWLIVTPNGNCSLEWQRRVMLLTPEESIVWSTVLDYGVE